MSFIIDQVWYGKHPLRWVLWPFSLFYQGIFKLRKAYLRYFRQQHFKVPIIVVGNLTVGGVGKTPLVIALAKAFKARGLRVGIVSRGYGAVIKTFPYEVTANDQAQQIGDEPLLIVQKTACPVVIAPKRAAAVQYLLDNHHSEIIISDDGLQHYAMGRAIEIAVIDGMRGFGNGFCLPAGPLRESKNRLQQVDLLVVNEGVWPNAHPMQLIPGELTHLATGQKIAKERLLSPVAAVAAIGNPERFFITLAAMGLTIIKYPLPDHYCLRPSELQFPQQAVVMTEKDAVKYQAYAADSWYFLPVEAVLSDSFWQALWTHEYLQDYL